MGFISDFTVFYKDFRVAEVHFQGKRPTILKFVPDSCMQPFGGSRTDILRIYEFLKSRCYEDGRADLPGILRQAGLKENNPWEWVRLTHGVTWEDFFWIRFPGEKITWEDVRIR